MAEIKVDRLVGLLDYRGMTVRYMPHMPELQGVSGKARYEGGTLHFDVASGTAVNLKIAGATIDLTGLDGRRRSTPRSACRSPARRRTSSASWRGPSSACRGTCSTTTERLGGDVAVDLSLGFPLLNTLAVADHRHQGRGVAVALLAARMRSATSTSPTPRRASNTAVRNSTSAARASSTARRRDRLARAVRRQGDRSAAATS